MSLEAGCVVETGGQEELKVWVAPSRAREGVCSRVSAVSPLWALLPAGMSWFKDRCVLRKAGASL